LAKSKGEIICISRAISVAETIAEQKIELGRSLLDGDYFVQNMRRR
jgi:hypothetical protein